MRTPIDEDPPRVRQAPSLLKPDPIPEEVLKDPAYIKAQEEKARESELSQLEQ